MLLKKISNIINIVKKAKISIKITALYAVMFLIVLLFLNTSILFGVKYYLYNQAGKQVEDIQNIITNKLTAQNYEVYLSDSEFFSDIPSKENIFIRILNEEGKVLNSSGTFDFKSKKSHEYKKIANSKEKYIEDKERHLIYKNVTLESKKNGTLNIQIFKDMYNEYQFMEILFVVMAIADFIGLIASIVLGYIISKRMLKPIDYITKTAEKISINNLKERIDVKGPDDELKRLANTFNNMIDGLQGAFDKQIQFVSDASHELRTPIAVIQGYANLLDRWGKDDKNALEKSIYGIKLEATNMANLIEKLLILAKGDSGTQLVEKKEFYLNELINEVVKESELIAQGHRLSSSRNDKVKVFADYKMIKQMLRIFIENSIKFTPAGGSIDVSSEANNSTVKIIVSDTGIGIPKEEIKNIFDRFYVVDKSRSKENGGTGIGLSIAKWIVNMHKGSVVINSENGKWTKVIVTLNLEN